MSHRNRHAVVGATGRQSHRSRLLEREPESGERSRQQNWIGGDFRRVRSVRAQEVVEGPFDLVYTSIGTIGWLPYPLVAWAKTIDALLKPGGTFFIRDGHPMLFSIDVDNQDGLVIGYPYFPTGEPIA